MGRLAFVRVLILAMSAALLPAHVSLAESPIRQLTDTDASNLRPAWSPDGRRITFQSNRDGAYHIYVMDADGANARQLTRGNVDDRHPAWSPDAKYIAFDSGDAQRREIWVIEVATGTRRQVTRLGAITSFPSWSPDGKRISFFVYQAGAMDLWVVTPDGGGPTQLTRSLAAESRSQCTFACHAAAWSPDNSRIALSDGDLARVLLMAPQVESALRPISPEGEKSHFPAYLSDGRVVYVTEHLALDESWTDLWAVDPNTGTRTELARRIQAQGPFELSADGRQLLFASPRSGNFEIYAVTLDDAGKAALATRGQGATPVSQTTPAGLGPPSSLSPEVIALAVIALLVIGIQATVWLRRRRARA